MGSRSETRTIPGQRQRYEEHLTPAQLAERWQCSTGWLANQRSAGTGIRYRRLGSKILYALSDILAYEAASTVEPLA